MPYLANIYRADNADYSYNSGSDTHNFITTGASVGNEKGTYLKGFPTREILFDNRITVNQVDIQTEDEYIILWKMDSPEGAQADYELGVVDNSAIVASEAAKTPPVTIDSYSGLRCEGYGPSASLQLRRINGNLNVCLVKYAVDNTPVAAAQINTGQEFYIRTTFQRSGNSITDPSLSNGILKTTAYLTYRSVDNPDPGASGIQLGWNASWRHIPYWGCILSDSIAQRGNTNSVSFRATKIGKSFTIDESVDPVVTQQNFISVLGNPDRVYSS